MTSLWLRQIDVILVQILTLLETYFWRLAAIRYYFLTLIDFSGLVKKSCRRHESCHNLWGSKKKIRNSHINIFFNLFGYHSFHTIVKCIRRKSESRMTVLPIRNLWKEEQRSAWVSGLAHSRWCHRRGRGRRWARSALGVIRATWAPPGCWPRTPSRRPATRAARTCPGGWRSRHRCSPARTRRCSAIRRITSSSGNTPHPAYNALQPLSLRQSDYNGGLRLRRFDSYRKWETFPDDTCLCGLPTYRVKGGLCSGRKEPNSSGLTRASCLSCK